MKKFPTFSGRRSPRRPADDSGYSIVEVIVTIALMSLAVIPLMVAALTLTTSSSDNRMRSKVETALRNAADHVNRANTQKNCKDYTEFARAPIDNFGWDLSQLKVEHQWYEPAADATQAGTWTAGVCPATGFRDDLVQLVTITIESPDGSISKTTQVVKSDDV
jgi:type II secretory pathway pseudopilin PulG